MHNISIIACTGSPRSGLNVLSACFQKLGYPACNHIHPNPETIDSLLLQDLGCPSGPITSGWQNSEASKSARERIDKFLCSALTNSSTGSTLQITLNPLTLSLWLDTFQGREVNLKLVHLIRHPYEVALSLQANQGLDLTHGHILWLSHIRAATRALEGQGYSLITFDQLLADPVSTLNSFLAPCSSHFSPETSAALLDFVQPHLKNHYVSDLSGSEQETFAPYARLYDQIRSRQYAPPQKRIEASQTATSSMGKISLPRETEVPSGVFHRGEGSPAQLNTRSVGEAIQPGLTQTSSDLIDSLLQALSSGHTPLTNNNYQLTEEFQLSVTITIPTANNETPISKPFPLIENQWQKITLPVKSTYFHKPVSFVLNSKTAALISAITIRNKATGDYVWSANTPAELDTLATSGQCLTVVHGNNLALITTDEDSGIRLPVIDSLPDLPLELEMWIKPGVESRPLLKAWAKERKTKKKFTTFLSKEALREFEDYTGLTDYRGSDLYKISDRSCHFLSTRDNIFYKGYDLNQTHYQNEVNFFADNILQNDKQITPAFIGSEKLENVIILKFAVWPGYRSKLEQWPGIGARVLKTLTDKLYLNSLEAKNFQNFLTDYLPCMDKHESDFAPLLELSTQIPKEQVWYCQVHGDFKLPNVMVNDDNEWRLVDWEATESAPLYVDPLKAALDFARRTKDSFRMLEAIPVLIDWAKIINSRLPDTEINTQQIASTLFASAVHLVYQEVTWGNSDCLNNNYSVLLPLLKNTVTCLQSHA